MGTQTVHLKLSFLGLVRWACRAGTRDFCPALAALVGPVKNIFFPHRTLFPFLCPHRPASWAVSRAGSPVSQYASLDDTMVLRVFVYHVIEKERVLLQCKLYIIRYGRPI